MSDFFELATHYPSLTSSLKDYYPNLPDDPKDFISYLFSSEDREEISIRTNIMFKAAIDNLENVFSYKVDKINVYMYILIKILLTVLNDTILTNRMANLYSKINYYDLLQENDSIIYRICTQELELKIGYDKDGETYGIKIYEKNVQNLRSNFKIHFIDYLKLATNLRDEYRKLTNNAVSNGFIHLEKKRLVRLLQERIRSKILEVETSQLLKDIEEKNELLKNSSFRELIEKISVEWKARKEEFEPLEFDGTEDSTLYPPCIQEILSKAKEGQNLIHTERLFIVWFLLALNLSTEEIVKVFSTMPDFDQEKTMYQVNFAKRKGYKVYLCETLKSLDLCKANKDQEKICTEGYYSKTQDKRREIRSPLQYVNIKRYRVLRREQYNYNNENNRKND